MVGVKLQYSNFIAPIKDYLNELEKIDTILLFTQISNFEKLKSIA